jgi:hypothetical protein
MLSKGAVTRWTSTCWCCPLSAQVRLSVGGRQGYPQYYILHTSSHSHVARTAGAGHVLEQKVDANLNLMLLLNTEVLTSLDGPSAQVRVCAACLSSPSPINMSRRHSVSHIHVSVCVHVNLNPPAPPAPCGNSNAGTAAAAAPAPAPAPAGAASAAAASPPASSL